MFIGELDYDSTFLDNEHLESEEYGESLAIFVQLISVLVLSFGTIVIMNLLVGLTVNEIDDLKKKAAHIILNQMTRELIQDELPFFGSLRAKLDSRQAAIKETDEESDKSSSNDDEIQKPTSLFKHLLDEREKIYPKFGKEEEIKICIRLKDSLEVEPKGLLDYIYELWHKINEFLPDFLRHTGHKVYFYKEGHIPKKEDYTGFRFQKELVDNTIECLKAKEDMKAELEGQLEEPEDLKDVISRHSEEILEKMMKKFDETMKNFKT